MTRMIHEQIVTNATAHESSGTTRLVLRQPSNDGFWRSPSLVLVPELVLDHVE